MKKVIIILLAVIGSFSTMSSFAQDKIPSAVTKSLQYSFENVTQASWSKVSDLYKAEFIFNNQVISAFYNEDGDLVATGREVETTQLPIALQIGLKNNYKDYTFAKAIEVNIGEDNSYYITIESATKIIHLKSTSFGKWEVYQKSNILKVI
ncbi:MAG: hypothetical protein ABI151_05345 [Chitinophagaceae bacterium]